ncbi:hypothetical protein ATCC90586_010307 [Pythium insidiosum]|nr:hypothetical protein ATCC90586_010307 [Pythium insidiosum]
MLASQPQPTPVDWNELARSFNATEVQEWLNSSDVTSAIDRSRREIERATKDMQASMGSSASSGIWSSVGIVLGVLVVVALVGAAVFFRWRRTRNDTSSVSTAANTTSRSSIAVFRKESQEHRGSERPILVLPSSSSTSSSAASSSEPSAPTATASFFRAVNGQPHHPPAPHVPSAPTADTALRLHLLKGDSAPPLWEDPLIVLSRLPFEAVTVSTLVSRGAYGEVFDGVCFGQRVAVKRLSPLRRKNLDDVHSLLVEVKLQASLEHARIVKFIGVAWDTLSNLSVVTEFMAGGDLRGALSDWRDDGRATGWDAQKHTLARHVAEALVYLHSLSPAVLHRDLKSRNILLDESQQSAKVTDFGVSRQQSEETLTLTGGVGTSLWMAPEVMRGDRYDDRADVFSFGLVLSELDTHELPYSSMRRQMAQERPNGSVPEMAVLQRVLNGTAHVALSPSLPTSLRELVLACVASSAGERPTMAEVISALQCLNV